jgi:tetratricopeptide (TPR) repeat protein
MALNVGVWHFFSLSVRINTMNINRLPVAFLFFTGLLVFNLHLSAGSLEEGIALHDRAFMDPACIGVARAVLEPLAGRSPLAQAYYGSVLTMEAKAIGMKNFIKAFITLNEGVKNIDQALGHDPNNKQIRAIRLVTGCLVDEKSPLDRHKIVGEDVAWFAETKPELDDLTQALVCLYEGIYWLKEKNRPGALAAFDRCLSLSADAELTRRAPGILNLKTVC